MTGAAEIDLASLTSLAANVTKQTGASESAAAVEPETFETEHE